MWSPSMSLPVVPDHHEASDIGDIDAGESSSSCGIQRLNIGDGDRGSSACAQEVSTLAKCKLCHLSTYRRTNSWAHPCNRACCEVSKVSK